MEGASSSQRILKELLDSPRHNPTQVEAAAEGLTQILDSVSSNYAIVKILLKAQEGLQNSYEYIRELELTGVRSTAQTHQFFTEMSADLTELNAVLASDLEDLENRPINKLRGLAEGILNRVLGAQDAQKVIDALSGDDFHEHVNLVLENLNRWIRK